MVIMPDSAPTNSKIVAAYRERTPGSAQLAETAQGLFPSGVTHDGRYLEPYGIYVERAAGPHKWDVDGNRYIDFFGGHGALLFGHNRREIVDAAAGALAGGTHFGANHPGEVRWAAAVQRLVPSAERVRFTSSGTEATLMAVRLARAFTKKPVLLRFLGHFHGWHDHMTSGYTNHFDGSATVGVLPGIAEKSILLPAGDIEALRACLAARDDVAAAILEPTGASFGQVPIAPAYLTALREITQQHGVLLIFDEVVTGFRVSSGGAQGAFGIRPDLSSFAKILAGGLPGGAVVGRRDLFEYLDFAATRASGREKIQHPGTYNANPVSAAAGAEALRLVAETDASARANVTAAALRGALNEVLAAEGIPWAVYGTSSGFHLFMNPKGRKLDPRGFDPFAIGFEELKTMPAQTVTRLRLALLVCGVDVNGRIGGFLSAAHGTEEVRETEAAWREALRLLRAEGELPG
jgi:glutamate-1-semialdehyde 2,1-aminomutase